MNNKHSKTIEAINSTPTLANIRFSDIESLLIALGADCAEGNGSRVRFLLNGMEWYAHKPHPGKEAKRYQVEGVREFLHKLGITQ